jgi:mannosyltransferase
LIGRVTLQAAVRTTAGIRLRPAHAVAAATVVAALLRLAVLDVQSFQFDEAVTVAEARSSFEDMLTDVIRDEETPPLYFVLAWGWGHVLGTGEIGLRSLSALAGIALVPIAYLTGREAVSSRAGVIAAALVAVNPYLVWYSQEARAYALFALLGATSVLFFVRALADPRRLDLCAWATVAVLAGATHHFALFLVAGEAGFLLAARRCRRVASAVAVVAGAGLALSALAVYQREHGPPAWIAALPFDDRVAELARDFLEGPRLHEPAVVASAGVLVAAALVAAAIPARVNGGRYVVMLAALALVTFALPALFAAAGLDYLYHRNLIPVVFITLVLAAAGIVGVRAPWGLAGAAALAAVWIAAVSLTFYDPANRHDWRAVQHALATPKSGRVIVVTPPLDFLAFQLYASVGALPEEGVVADDIAVIAPTGLDSGDLPTLHSGFRQTGSRTFGTLVLRTYHSPRAVRLGPATVAPGEPYARGQQLLVG